MKRSGNPTRPTLGMPSRIMTTENSMLHWLRLLVIVLAVPAFGACGKKNAPTDDQASPAVSAAAATPGAKATPKGPPLKIAYSDWPGWVAWDIGVRKEWFKEAGVDVDLVWFEYVPSMEAFTAGKVDAVCMTNGDALVTGSSGAPSVAILLNDYSNGNDMVVAKPGIKSVAELKGKKVGVEVGFVSHLLLLNALKSAGLTQDDITIVNVPTDQTPQTLKSGKVDAIVAWQPNSGQALKELPGSTAIFSSANVPGVIYDVLAVNPKSLAERREDWLKVAQVWFKIADFVKDPKNLDEAAKIMSARVGLSADEYKKLVGGTYFLDLKGNLKHFAKGPGLESVYGSSKVVDDFQTTNKVYKAPVKYESFLDPSLVLELGRVAAL
jgi:NitT/TauT family transport system substrate-binding protein